MEYEQTTLDECIKPQIHRLDYNGVLRTKLKQIIRERDGYTCRLCGLTRYNHYNTYWHLPIHHIDWKSEHNTHTNLITLCSSCHGKVHRRENNTDQYKHELLIKNIYWIMDNCTMV